MQHARGAERSPFIAIKKPGDDFYTWYARRDTGPISPPVENEVQTVYLATGRMIGRESDDKRAEVYEIDLGT